MNGIKALRAPLLAAAAGLGGTLAWGLPAYASGFGLREGSADWLGTAFSGNQAKAYDASTAWSNPAGMALLDHDEVDGAVSMIAPSTKFSGYATNPLTGTTTTGGPGGNAVAPAATGALFGVMVLSPDLRLGFSVTSPFGERVAYPSDFVGRYQSLVSNITDINYGIALSYKINDHLSIGGGPDFDYFQARLTQNLNIPTLSALTGQSPVADIHGNSLGIGYNLGVLYQIDDATRIGFDYHSRIRHNIHGAQTLSIPAIYSLYSPGTVALLNQANSGATTSITLPDSAGLAIYHQITPAWAVMGSVEWTDWSLFKTLAVTATNGSGGTVIHENWRNTWFAGIGTNYYVTDRLMLQGGIAFDQSPVTTANRTTRVPDADHYDVGIGAQYQLLRNARLELAYGHIFSHGGGINNSASPAAGTIKGRYADSDNSVTAGLNMTF
ncbi:OmpP1/FadL family transporter [Acidocella sp.]|uniref:OmpP1/FadL family transporter n=1 Tax=Acidocella sp. TaxID=50710 RepID=UPI0026351359|nr:outer membrane protein transport protein [Acidocella sp.]